MPEGKPGKAPLFEKQGASEAEMYRHIEELAAGDVEAEERMLQELDELDDLPVGSTKTVQSASGYLKATKRSENDPKKKQSAEYDIERG